MAPSHERRRVADDPRAIRPADHVLGFVRRRVSTDDGTHAEVVPPVPVRREELGNAMPHLTRPTYGTRRKGDFALQRETPTRCLIAERHHNMW